jgi:hypothetical protein
MAILLMLAGLAIGSLPIFEFTFEHRVHAELSAILACALVILSFFSLGLGLILNSVNLRLLEVEKLVRKWDVREMREQPPFTAPDSDAATRK